MKIIYFLLSICFLLHLSSLAAQNTKIAKRLEEFKEQQKQEKVYLHLNKPYYSLQETIWFKAYLVDAQTHFPNSNSQVIYVDLIDPNGQLLSSRMLHATGANHSSFELPPDAQAGQYIIRAYTQYMRNFDPSFFYRKAFMIYDLRLKNNNSVSSKHQESDRPFRLQFFPEGGELISGFPMNVAFEARDTSGRPIDLEGEIVDQDGQLVTRFRTSYQGSGFFNIKAEKGKTYFAKVNYQFFFYEFPLPNASENGFVLKVNNNQVDRLKVILLSSYAKGLKGAYLIGHSRGTIFCNMDDLIENEVISFPKEKLPLGLLHFTLFDSKGKPRAERLVFNDWGLDEELIKVFQPYSFYYPRQKVELQLQVNETLRAIPLSLSASVTDQAVVKYPSSSENCQSYFLLNSDLKNPIKNASYYLQDINPQKRFLLDLLLMTKGWRRFRWEDIQSKKKAEHFFQAELGYSITGYTTSKNNESQRVASNVMLTSLSENFYVDQFTTDESGFFKFTNLPYLDTVNFTLQGESLNIKKKKKRKRKEQGAIKLEGRRDVKIHLETMFKPEVQDLTVLPIDAPSSLADYLRYERQSNLVDSVYKTDWEIDLDEVVVKSTRKQDARIRNAFDLNKLDWIPPNRTAVNLLSTLRPGKTNSPVLKSRR